MTTINNIEDFLRILREDEAVRSAVRRELLSEELLALPERMSALVKSVEEYKESTDKRFDIVESRLDRQDEMLREYKESTDKRFDIVESRLDRQDEILRQHSEMLKEHSEILSQHKESTDQRFDIVINRLDRQHEMYRQQHDAFGKFRGNYAIHAARRERHEIARLFARPRLMRRIQYSLLDDISLNDILNDGYEHLDALGFSGNTLDSFPMADLVIEVKDRRGRRPTFYVVVETSFTVDDGDAVRAAERAKILQCATGLDAYPVVAGVKLAPNFENIVLGDAGEFMEMDHENIAFWYQIVEEDLEPFELC